MSKEPQRPRSVTFISALFVAAGIIGVAYHATELDTQGPLEASVVWVLFVRVLAIVAGVYMLRGADWARWLALAWLAFHVVLSAFHSLSEAVIHFVLLAVLAYTLLRPEARTYFRGARRQPGQPFA